MGTGAKIVVEGARIIVPEHPVIPFIQGDGIGPEVWSAARAVLDVSVELAYGSARSICWIEALAGEKAYQATGGWLPTETLRVLKEHVVSIKGPLATPVGGGIRSLNVAIRQALDLYACVRPVRWYNGVPCPVLHPERVDVVIFRENTEDVYAGIEWERGSAEARRLIEFLRDEMGVGVRPDSGLGIKPMSEFGSKRLVRKAIRHALDQGRRSITLVQKGNIMKFTEGAFAKWGYELACDEFGDVTITERDVAERHGGRVPRGRLVVKDRIADNMFQQVLLRPEEYDVIAAPNLNGDYLSDAVAAQVGGLGMAPGSNEGDAVAVFEATHGTAPKYAGQDRANPSSLILSGAMMLRYLGWAEAADLIEQGMEATFRQKVFTYDLARLVGGATEVGTSEFAMHVMENMRRTKDA